jgi:hypothetical protein
MHARTQAILARANFRPRARSPVTFLLCIFIIRLSFSNLLTHTKDARGALLSPKKIAAKLPHETEQNGFE